MLLSNGGDKLKMIELKLGTVVSNDGRHIDLVAFDPDTKIIESYQLKDGEVLVESTPNGQLKPVYNFEKQVWEEGASKEEIAAHEKALEEEKRKREEASKQQEPAVSKTELMLGMTSMYEEMLKKDAENKMALAEIYELALNK